MLYPNRFLVLDVRTYEEDDMKMEAPSVVDLRACIASHRKIALLCLAELT